MHTTTAFAFSMLLASLAAGAQAATCLPIAATTPAACTNDFDLRPPNTNDTSLISSVEAGSFNSSIKYRFVIPQFDAQVKVDWRDEHGAVLFSATNAGWFGTIPVDAFVWGETRTGRFNSRTAEIREGTIDFTGSVGTNMPCTGACRGGHHKFLPSPLNPQRTGAAAGAEPADLDASISGDFEYYEFDPAAPGDFERATTIKLLEFSSAAEWTGSDYLYTYAITNHSTMSFNVLWAAALLDGVLDEGESITRSFTSALAPGLTASQTVFGLGPELYSGGLNMVQPIPVPAPALLLGSALACLLAGMRKRRSCGC